MSITTFPLYGAIVADMGNSEASIYPVYNGPAQWPIRGLVDMGCAPRGDAIPTSDGWTTIDNQYISSAYWNAICPWFLLYPGTLHTATNVRCKIYDITCYILSKSSNTWSRSEEHTSEL